MSEDHVDAIICGVELKGLRIMASLYPGFDIHAKRRFNAGVQIAYLHHSRLTQEQIQKLFPNGKPQSISVHWPLQNSYATKQKEDAEAAMRFVEKDVKKEFPKEIKFTPNINQEAILNTTINTEDNILIDAKAGSGKTSTLIWLVKELAKMNLIAGKRVIYLAFNKSIQEELSLRLQGTGVTALTTHAFGLSILRKIYGNGIKPFTGRVASDAFIQCVCVDNGLNSTSFKAARNTVEYAIRASVLEMVGYIKSWAIFPFYDGGWKFTNEQKETIKEFIEMYEVDLIRDFTANDLVDYACRVVIQALPEPGQHVSEVDFDDLLYLPLALNLEVPKFDLVLTDESQDFNFCQIMLLEKMIG